MILTGKTKYIDTGCGVLKITLNRTKNNKLAQTFIRMGKNGSCSHVFLEGISRLIGLALRYSIPVEEIAEELVNLSCPNGTWDGGVLIKSCLDGVGQTLMEEMNDAAKTAT